LQPAEIEDIDLDPGVPHATRLANRPQRRQDRKMLSAPHIPGAHIPEILLKEPS